MNLFQETDEARQQTDTRCAGETVVTPLRKRRINGELYQRDPKTEALIAELALLSRDELIARAGVTNRADAGYIPSECLTYFIRASRHDNNDLWFERLYRFLIERVLRSLRKADILDGTRESLSLGTIRDNVYSRFVDMLSADRITPNGKLDFFEVRFDCAVAKLRSDAQRKVWRYEKRFQPLEYDEKASELSPQIERAAGAFDPPDAPNLDDPAYRSAFDAAIMTLPPEQARIIHMMRLGFPFDSKEPNVMTIAKALGRSEKTIRNYRDKAFIALRTAMPNGEEL